jgi:riboflavin synthase
MFTGIITDVGSVESIEDLGGSKRIAIACGYPAESIAIGASIANDGICLTVTTLREAGDRTIFTIDASAETIARTTMGAWRIGRAVNLERSLRLGDELGGHIVTGHVDGVADLVSRDDVDGTSRFVFQAPRSIAKFIAEKGSVALNGTSLTVNSVDGERFTVTMIPHTLAVTTWHEARAGDRINIEADMMARYAARLADARAAGY